MAVCSLRFLVREVSQEKTIFLITILLSCLMAIAINLFYYYRSPNIVQCSRLGCPFIALFIVLLAYHGGYQDTGLYWLYPFPIVLLILLGAKLGGIVNIAVFSAISFLLFHPELIIAQYSRAEVTRFIASYAVLIGIAFISEYYREQSHRDMIDVTHDKERVANTDPLTQLANRRYYLP